jgi:hypothetical protein
MENKSNKEILPIPLFKDVEEIKLVAGKMLGEGYLNPATGMSYDVSIENNDTVSVSVDRAFRDSILKTLSDTQGRAKHDKRFTNVRQEGNSILADLVTPIGGINKVEFAVEKYRV